MATLKQISDKISHLHGDMTFRQAMSRNLVFLGEGRRGHHDFVVKSNIRTLRSGPNRGKLRVDGATLVMFGNKNKAMVKTALVRDGARLLKTLDRLASDLSKYGE